MYKILTTSRFDSIIKKKFQQNPIEIRRIKETIINLSENPFKECLNTHKLKGALCGFYACSCGYDCRIIFSIEKDKNNNNYLLLMDIGKHNDVY